MDKCNTCGKDLKPFVYRVKMNGHYLCKRCFDEMGDNKEESPKKEKGSNEKLTDFLDGLIKD